MPTVLQEGSANESNSAFKKPAGMNLRRKPEKRFALQIHTRLGIDDY